MDRGENIGFRYKQEKHKDFTDKQRKKHILLKNRENNLRCHRKIEGKSIDFADEQRGKQNSQLEGKYRFHG